jgi:hypothetical protein
MTVVGFLLEIAIRFVSMLNVSPNGCSGRSARRFATKPTPRSRKVQDHPPALRGDSKFSKDYLAVRRHRTHLRCVDAHSWEVEAYGKNSEFAVVSNCRIEKLRRPCGPPHKDKRCL